MNKFVKTFHTIVLVPFVLTLGIFRTMSSCFIIDFEQVNTGWESFVKWKIYVIFILILLVPLFRPSVFIVFFFYISIYRGYYALPCHDFKANRQEEKTIFKMATEHNQKQHF